MTLKSLKPSDMGSVIKNMHLEMHLHAFVKVTVLQVKKTTLLQLRKDTTQIITASNKLDVLVV